MVSRTALKDIFDAAGITVILPSESEYSSVSAYYQLLDPKVPLAVLRPQNADEVGVAVTYAAQQGLEIMVRSGGGDLFGRSQSDGALVLDMRQICHVHVDPGTSIARVGGGCSVGMVAESLAQHGVATTLPLIPALGYVGYATLGGYGPFACHFGLGVDQILAAKLVNSEGKLVDADEEMLKGIRGGGGNFGVIVELSIRVYPLEKILGGWVFFEASDVDSAFQAYAHGYNELLQEGVPPELGVQPVVVNTEGGRMLVTLFVWSSPDHALGKLYLEKVAALGKEAARMVSAMTVREWQEEMNKLIPYGVYGFAMSVRVKQVTEQVARIIGKHLAKMPSDKSTSFSWHELRGKSTHADDGSVFLAREAHFVLELLGQVVNEEKLEESQAWADSFRRELLQCDAAMPSDYISVTTPSHTNLERLYGANLAELQRLKKKYDPKGVFDLAVPRLGELS